MVDGPADGAAPSSTLPLPSARLAIRTTPPPPPSAGMALGRKLCGRQLSGRWALSWDLVRSHVAQRNAQGDRYKALYRIALSGHVQSPPLRQRRLFAALADLHAQLPHKAREGQEVDRGGQSGLEDDTR